MTSSSSESEPITPEFRTEVVTKFCRDFATGAVVYDRTPQREMTEKGVGAAIKVSTELSKGVQAYSSPESTPEQRTKLEPHLYQYILIARAHGIVKDTLNKSKLEENIENIDARFEAMRKLQIELLLVMKEVTPKLDEVMRKIDRL